VSSLESSSFSSGKHLIVSSVIDWNAFTSLGAAHELTVLIGNAICRSNTKQRHESDKEVLDAYSVSTH